MSDANKRVQELADEIRLMCLEQLADDARRAHANQALSVEYLAQAVTSLAGPPGRLLEASPLGSYAQPEHPERDALVSVFRFLATAKPSEIKGGVEEWQNTARQALRVLGAEGGVGHRDRVRLWAGGKKALCDEQVPEYARDVIRMIFVLVGEPLPTEAIPSHIDEPAEGSFPRGQRA